MVDAVAEKTRFGNPKKPQRIGYLCDQPDHHVLFSSAKKDRSTWDSTYIAYDLTIHGLQRAIPICLQVAQACIFFSLAFIGVSWARSTGSIAIDLYYKITSGVEVACTSISYISLGALAYQAWIFFVPLGHWACPLTNLFWSLWTPTAPIALAATPASLIGATTVYGQVVAMILTAKASVGAVWHRGL